MHLKSINLITGILLVFWIPCSAQLTHVNFMPQWLPQAQFAGYYVASNQGFYVKEGLDVNVMTGGPLAPAFDFLREGKADLISAFLSGAIQERDSGLPLVNVAQLSQRSALMFVSRKADQINNPVDFDGKRIGIWRTGFQELPLSFLKRNKIEPGRIIQINATIGLFYNGGLDILCLMWYNEYHRLYESGIDTSELNTFFLSDYGLNVPEDGIYCTSDYAAANPGVVDRFVRATIKGWEWAFNHEEEAIDLVIAEMKKKNVPHNRAQQRWMLRRMNDLMHDKDGKLCTPLTRESYLLANKILFENKMIQRVYPFAGFVSGNANQ